MNVLLCAVFFVSGAAALLFETLWFHQAGLMLGNSVWATSLVLASFMGGLAVGNGLVGWFGSHLRRPVRVYAVLEFSIGLTGLALVLVLPELSTQLRPLFRAVLDQPWALNALRLAVAFALLLVPSTAMGMTLPVLVAALVRRDVRFGCVLGRLYAWNTLGGVVGALAGALALIEWLGIRGTAIGAATLNVGAGLVALAVARSADRASVPAQDAHRPPRLPAQTWGLLLAAGLCGFILLALEVVWFRFLLFFVVGTDLAFAAMLSTVLVGIGAGSLVAARAVSWWPGAYRVTPLLALGAGLVAIVAYASLDPLVSALPGVGSSRWQDVLKLGAPLMLPVSLLSGALFTLVGDAFNRAAPGTARAAGYVTLANTTGAMLGSTAGAFVLLAGIGIERSIQFLAALYGLAAIGLMVAGLRPAGRTHAIGWGLVTALLVVAASRLSTGAIMHGYVAHRFRHYATTRHEMPVAFREGLTETLTLLRHDQYDEPIYYRLITNGYSMSSTGFASQRYMKLFAYLPVSLHPDLRRVLLIGYGVGNTAQALTAVPSVERIDVVDTSRDLIDLSRTMVGEGQTSPLDDARVRVTIEDGRYFLQTRPHRYDLITGEPPPPVVAGVVNLYTREYFRLARQRLAQGGIITYWVPAHSLLEQDVKTILRAFCDVFEDCSLWAGAGLDWILMGSRGAAGPGSVAQIARWWQEPNVGSDLQAIGLEAPAQLGALFMADASTLRAWTDATPPLTDDFPKRLSQLSLQAEQFKQSVAFHRQVMNVDATRARFLKSEFIARLLPHVFREASQPYFAIQGVFNAQFRGDFRRPLTELPVVHDVLTQTSLELPILLLLGSYPAEQQAVDAALAKGRRAPDLDYRLGVRALARREYERAATHFGEGLRRGSRHRELLYYQIYALAMAGRLAEAGQIMAAWGMPGRAYPTDQQFVGLLQERFDLPGDDPLAETAPP